MLSASESLFGFMGWLTSRVTASTFSSHHDAGEAADLVKVFCEANNLPEPRDGWAEELKRPV